MSENNEFVYNLKITADTSDANKSIEETNERLEQLEKKGLETQGKMSDEMKNVIMQNSPEAKQYLGQYRSAQDELQRVIEQVNFARTNGREEYNKKYGKTASYESLETRMFAAEQKVQELMSGDAVSIQALGSSLSELGGVIPKVNETIKALSGTINTLLSKKEIGYTSDFTGGAKRLSTDISRDAGTILNQKAVKAAIEKEGLTDEQIDSSLKLAIASSYSINKTSGLHERNAAIRDAIEKPKNINDVVKGTIIEKSIAASTEAGAKTFKSEGWDTEHKQSKYMTENLYKLIQGYVSKGGTTVNGLNMRGGGLMVNLLQNLTSASGKKITSLADNGDIMLSGGLNIGEFFDSIENAIFKMFNDVAPGLYDKKNLYNLNDKEIQSKLTTSLRSGVTGELLQIAKDMETFKQLAQADSSIYGSHDRIHEGVAAEGITFKDIDKRKLEQHTVDKTSFKNGEMYTQTVAQPESSFSRNLDWNRRERGLAPIGNYKKMEGVRILELNGLDAAVEKGDTKTIDMMESAYTDPTMMSTGSHGFSQDTHQQNKEEYDYDESLWRPFLKKLTGKDNMSHAYLQEVDETGRPVVKTLTKEQYSALGKEEQKKYILAGDGLYVDEEQTTKNAKVNDYVNKQYTPDFLANRTIKITNEEYDKLSDEQKSLYQRSGVQKESAWVKKDLGYFIVFNDDDTNTDGVAFFDPSLADSDVAKKGGQGRGGVNMKGSFEFRNNKEILQKSEMSTLTDAYGNVIDIASLPERVNFVGKSVFKNFNALLGDKTDADTISRIYTGMLQEDPLAIVAAYSQDKEADALGQQATMFMSSDYGRAVAQNKYYDKIRAELETQEGFYKYVGANNPTIPNLNGVYDFTDDKVIEAKEKYLKDLMAKQQKGEIVALEGETFGQSRLVKSMVSMLYENGLADMDEAVKFFSKKDKGDLEAWGLLDENGSIKKDVLRNIITGTKDAEGNNLIFDFDNLDSIYTAASRAPAEAGQQVFARNAASFVKPFFEYMGETNLAGVQMNAESKENAAGADEDGDAVKMLSSILSSNEAVAILKKRGILNGTKEQNRKKIFDAIKNRTFKEDFGEAFKAEDEAKGSTVWTDLINNGIDALSAKTEEDNKKRQAKSKEIIKRTEQVASASKSPTLARHIGDWQNMLEQAKQNAKARMLMGWASLAGENSAGVDWNNEEAVKNLPYYQSVANWIYDAGTTNQKTPQEIFEGTRNALLTLSKLPMNMSTVRKDIEAAGSVEYDEEKQAWFRGNKNGERVYVDEQDLTEEINGHRYDKSALKGYTKNGGMNLGEGVDVSSHLRRAGGYTNSETDVNALIATAMNYNRDDDSFDEYRKIFEIANEDNTMLDDEGNLVYTYNTSAKNLYYNPETGRPIVEYNYKELDEDDGKVHTYAVDDEGYLVSPEEIVEAKVNQKTGEYTARGIYGEDGKELKIIHPEFDPEEKYTASIFTGKNRASIENLQKLYENIEAGFLSGNRLALRDEDVRIIDSALAAYDEALNSSLGGLNREKLSEILGYKVSDDEKARQEIHKKLTGSNTAYTALKGMVGLTSVGGKSVGLGTTFREQLANLQNRLSKGEITEEDYEKILKGYEASFNNEKNSLESFFVSRETSSEAFKKYLNTQYGSTEKGENSRGSIGSFSARKDVGDYTVNPATTAIDSIPVDTKNIDSKNTEVETQTVVINADDVKTNNNTENKSSVSEKDRADILVKTKRIDEIEEEFFNNRKDDNFAKTDHYKELNDEQDRLTKELSEIYSKYKQSDIKSMWNDEKKKEDLALAKASIANDKDKIKKLKDEMAGADQSSTYAQAEKEIKKIEEDIRVKIQAYKIKDDDTYSYIDEITYKEENISKLKNKLKDYENDKSSSEYQNILRAIENAEYQIEQMKKQRSQQEEQPAEYNSDDSKKSNDGEKTTVKYAETSLFTNLTQQDKRSFELLNTENRFNELINRSAGVLKGTKGLIPFNPEDHIGFRNTFDSMDNAILAADNYLHNTSALEGTTKYGQLSAMKNRMIEQSKITQEEYIKRLYLKGQETEADVLVGSNDYDSFIKNRNRYLSAIDEAKNAPALILKQKMENISQIMRIEDDNEADTFALELKEAGSDYDKLKALAEKTLSREDFSQTNKEGETEYKGAGLILKQALDLSSEAVTLRDFVSEETGLDAIATIKQNAKTSMLDELETIMGSVGDLQTKYAQDSNLASMRSMFSKAKHTKEAAMQKSNSIELLIKEFTNEDGTLKKEYKDEGITPELIARLVKSKFEANEIVDSINNGSFVSDRIDAYSSKSNQKFAKINEKLNSGKDLKESDAIKYTRDLDKIIDETTAGIESITDEAVQSKLEALRTQAQQLKESVAKSNEFTKEKSEPYIKKAEQDIVKINEDINKIGEDVANGKEVKESKKIKLGNQLRDAISDIEDKINNAVDDDVKENLEELKSKYEEALSNLDSKSKPEVMSFDDINDEYKKNTKGIGKNKLGGLLGEAQERGDSKTQKEIDNALEEKAALEKKIERLKTKAESEDTSEEDKQKAEKEIEEAEEEVNKIDERVSSLQDSLGSAGSLVKGLLSEGTGALFDAIQNFASDFAKRCVEVVTKLDAAMQNIQSITMKSDEEIEQIRKDVIRQSVDLKVSYEKVAEVQASLYRQGLSREEVNKNTEAVIKYSAVTEGDISSSLKALTTAVKSGLVDNVNTAMDVLVALGDTVATTAEEIAKGMQKSAAAAKNAGVEYEELATMLAIGTATTQLSGTQIGRGLNSIMSRFMKVTNEGMSSSSDGSVSINDVEGALANVGIAIRTSSDTFRDFTDVMVDISEGWEDYSDIQRSNIAYALAGTTQSNTFMSLMAGMAEGVDDKSFRELLEEARDSDGVTDEKYNIKTDTVEYALERFNTALDAVAANMFGLADLVKAIINFGADVINFFNSGEVTGTITSSGLIISAIAGLIGGPIAAAVGVGVTALAGSISSLIETYVNENKTEAKAKKENEQTAENLEYYKLQNKLYSKSIETINETLDYVNTEENKNKTVKELVGTEEFNIIAEELEYIGERYGYLTNNIDLTSITLKEFNDLLEATNRQIETKNKLETIEATKQKNLSGTNHLDYLSVAYTQDGIVSIHKQGGYQNVKDKLENYYTSSDEYKKAADAMPQYLKMLDSLERYLIDLGYTEEEIKPIKENIKLYGASKIREATDNKTLNLLAENWLKDLIYNGVDYSNIFKSNYNIARSNIGNVVSAYSSDFESLGISGIENSLIDSIYGELGAKIFTMSPEDLNAYIKNYINENILTPLEIGSAEDVLSIYSPYIYSDSKGNLYYTDDNTSLEKKAASTKVNEKYKNELNLTMASRNFPDLSEQTDTANRYKTYYENNIAEYEKEIEDQQTTYDTAMAEIVQYRDEILAKMVEAGFASMEDFIDESGEFNYTKFDEAADDFREELSKKYGRGDETWYIAQRQGWISGKRNSIAIIPNNIKTLQTNLEEAKLGLQTTIDTLKTIEDSNDLSVEILRTLSSGEEITLDTIDNWIERINVLEAAGIEISDDLQSKLEEYRQAIVDLDNAEYSDERLWNTVTGKYTTKSAQSRITKTFTVGEQLNKRQFVSYLNGFETLEDFFIDINKHTTLLDKYSTYIESDTFSEAVSAIERGEMSWESLIDKMIEMAEGVNESTILAADYINSIVDSSGKINSAQMFLNSSKSAEDIYTFESAMGLQHGFLNADMLTNYANLIINSENEQLQSEGIATANDFVNDIYAEAVANGVDTSSWNENTTVEEMIASFGEGYDASRFMATLAALNAVGIKPVGFQRVKNDTLYEEDGVMKSSEFGAELYEKEPGSGEYYFKETQTFDDGSVMYIDEKNNKWKAIKYDPTSGEATEFVQSTIGYRTIESVVDKTPVEGKSDIYTLLDSEGQLEGEWTPYKDSDGNIVGYYRTDTTKNASEINVREAKKDTLAATLFTDEAVAGSGTTVTAYSKKDLITSLLSGSYDSGAYTKKAQQSFATMFSEGKSYDEIVDSMDLNMYNLLSSDTELQTILYEYSKGAITAEEATEKWNEAIKKTASEIQNLNSQIVSMSKNMSTVQWYIDNADSLSMSQLDSAVSYLGYSDWDEYVKYGGTIDSLKIELQNVQLANAEEVVDSLNTQLTNAYYDKNGNVVTLGDNVDKNATKKETKTITGGTTKEQLIENGFDATTAEEISRYTEKGFAITLNVTTEYDKEGNVLGTKYVATDANGNPINTEDSNYTNEYVKNLEEAYKLSKTGNAADKTKSTTMFLENFDKIQQANYENNNANVLLKKLQNGTIEESELSELAAYLGVDSRYIRGNYAEANRRMGIKNNDVATMNAEANKLEYDALKDSFTDAEWAAASFTSEVGDGYSLAKEILADAANNAGKYTDEQIAAAQAVADWYEGLSETKDEAEELKASWDSTMESVTGNKQQANTLKDMFSAIKEDGVDTFIATAGTSEAWQEILNSSTEAKQAIKDYELGLISSNEAAKKLVETLAGIKPQYDDKALYGGLSGLYYLTKSAGLDLNTEEGQTEFLAQYAQLFASDSNLASQMTSRFTGLEKYMSATTDEQRSAALDLMQAEMNDVFYGTSFFSKYAQSAYTINTSDDDYVKDTAKKEVVEDLTDMIYYQGVLEAGDDTHPDWDAAMNYFGITNKDDITRATTDMKKKKSDAAKMFTSQTGYDAWAEATTRAAARQNETSTNNINAAKRSIADQTALEAALAAYENGDEEAMKALKNNETYGADIAKILENNDSSKDSKTLQLYELTYGSGNVNTRNRGQADALLALILSGNIEAAKTYAKTNTYAEDSLDYYYPGMSDYLKEKADMTYVAEAGKLAKSDREKADVQELQKYNLVSDEYANFKTGYIDAVYKGTEDDYIRHQIEGYQETIDSLSESSAKRQESQDKLKDYTKGTPEYYNIMRDYLGSEADGLEGLALEEKYLAKIASEEADESEKLKAISNVWNYATAEERQKWFGITTDEEFKDEYGINPEDYMTSDEQFFAAKPYEYTAESYNRQFGDMLSANSEMSNDDFVATVKENKDLYNYLTSEYSGEAGEIFRDIKNGSLSVKDGLDQMNNQLGRTVKQANATRASIRSLDKELMNLQYLKTQGKDKWTSEEKDEIASMMGYADYKEAISMGITDTDMEQYVNDAVTEKEKDLTDIWNNAYSKSVITVTPDMNVNFEPTVTVAAGTDYEEFVAMGMDEQMAKDAAYYSSLGYEITFDKTIETDENGDIIKVKYAMNSVKATGTKSSGIKKSTGGGGSSKDKVKDKWDKVIAVDKHLINLINTREEIAQSEGRLTDYGSLLEQEKKYQEQYRSDLEAAIAEEKKHMNSLTKNSDAWQSAKETVMSWEEELANVDKALIENEKKIKENAEAIRQTAISVQNMIRKEYETRKQIEKDMLSNTVSMQNTVLEAIKQRYQEESDLRKKSYNEQIEYLNKEKELLQERFNARSENANRIADLEELEELKRQYALISLDSTRSKERLELAKQIADKEKAINEQADQEYLESRLAMIDDQVTAYEDMIESEESDLEAFLEDANNFTEELNNILAMSQEDMLSWLQNNVKDFALSTAEAQQQMIDGWTDTFNAMHNITERWNEEILALMNSGTDAIMEFMLGSDAYANMTDEEKAAEEYRIQNLIDAWVNAYSDSNEIFSHTDEWGGTIASTTSEISEKVSEVVKNQEKENETQKDDSKTSKESKEQNTSFFGKVTGFLDGVADTLSSTWDYLKRTAAYNSSSSSSKTLGFATGGLADYTGWAWVDGTPQNPEYVLSATQWKDLLNLDYNNHVLAGSNYMNGQYSSIEVGGITINTNSISDDADIEELANKISDVLNEKINNSGFSTSRLCYR